MIVFTFLVCLTTIGAVPINITDTSTHPNIGKATPNPSRRIMAGRIVGDTRPYMVYLRAATGADPKITDTNWNCGGVIIAPRYILTSAACIEDAKHFYVVSGTHKWVPLTEKDNDCINNGAKKAVWKCVARAYHFDGNEFDNISWMIGDIAVVKVEDDFNFERRVRGCDFIPKKVFFNNQTEDLEKPGTQGSIAGWGTTSKVGDVIDEPAVNSPDLLETDAILISKKSCKKRWDSRYHFIIDDQMICTNDITDEATMSDACALEVLCKELVYSDEGEDDARRRTVPDPSKLVVHNPMHARRAVNGHRLPSGGFCENDHGGPLIVGQGKSSIVVGVMSAFMTKEITHKCYGPFLYTSVYRYRQLITCVIDKENEPTECKRMLRSSKTPMSETSLDWTGHLDGPSKTAINTKSNIFSNNVKTPIIPQLGNTNKPGENLIGFIK